MALTINIISPNKLRVNGPAKFIINTKNQKKEKKGLTLAHPLLITILRECDRSYKMLAPANMHDETRPWAIITHQAPRSPIFSINRRPKIIRAMCTTEE